jgi:hypothetical protein
VYEPLGKSFFLSDSFYYFYFTNWIELLKTTTTKHTNDKKRTTENDVDDERSCGPCGMHVLKLPVLVNCLMCVVSFSNEIKYWCHTTIATCLLHTTTSTTKMSTTTHVCFLYIFYYLLRLDIQNLNGNGNYDDTREWVAERASGMFFIYPFYKSANDYLLLIDCIQH